MEEAAITINGVALTVGQSMTVRCALTAFMAVAEDLGGDKLERALMDAYSMRSREVLTLIIGTDGGGV